MRLLAFSGGCDCQMRRTFGSDVDQFAAAFSASCNQVYVRYPAASNPVGGGGIYTQIAIDPGVYGSAILPAYGLWLQPEGQESPRRSAGSGDVAQSSRARGSGGIGAEFSHPITNSDYPMQAQAAGITFIGGTTATALFRDEFPAASTFNAVVSCDATGQPVFHAPMKFYRASLASPAYRNTLSASGRFRSTAAWTAVLR